MALTATLKGIEFGVGDTVRVIQRIVEGNKERLQAFEGMVIGIKGHGDGKTFTVRRIGSAQVGIERIFPFLTPTIENLEVVRKGVKGTRHAKLYYTRDKSKREIEKIYSRASRRSIETIAKEKVTKPKVKKVKASVKTKSKTSTKKIK